MSVSVVVPFRNSAHTLPRLLAALDAQSLPPDRFEVVLVDDASTDDGAAVAAAWAARDPDRRRVVAGTGAGPAAARNLGIARASGEWIAFTDADVVPDARWLAELLKAGGAADAVEGRVTPWPAGEIHANSHYVTNERGGLYITANMAYRRELIERVGGFDERFETAFLEDSDLAFRVLDLGVTIPFAPAALVRHGIVELDPRRVLRTARKLSWLALLARKHPDRYASDIRPLVRPVTRPEAHVLAGLGGLCLIPLGMPLVGALLAANGVRVLARDPRLRVPRREIPVQAALVVALPLAKVAWWAVGHARARSLERA